MKNSILIDNRNVNENTSSLVDQSLPPNIIPITFRTLSSINPRLVQASVNGFGSEGEYSQRPAFDFIAQAISGFMSLNGSEKTGPVRTAAPISDLIAGLYCAFGIVSAINARHNTKKGK